MPGVSWGAPFEEMPIERWRQVLEVNVIGTSLMTQAVLPAMKAKQYGKIINIVSIAGMMGLPKKVLEASAYTASKGALIALTRELAVNYAAQGIRVNAIAPGFFPDAYVARGHRASGKRDQGAHAAGPIRSRRGFERDRIVSRIGGIRLCYGTNHRRGRGLHRRLKPRELLPLRHLPFFPGIFILGR